MNIQTELFRRIEPPPYGWGQLEKRLRRRRRQKRMIKSFALASLCLVVLLLTIDYREEAPSTFLTNALANDILFVDFNKKKNDFIYLNNNREKLVEVGKTDKVTVYRIVRENN